MFVFVYSKSAQFVAIFILFRFRISDQPNEVEEEEFFFFFFLFRFYITSFDLEFAFDLQNRHWSNSTLASTRIQLLCKGKPITIPSKYYFIDQINENLV